MAVREIFTSKLITTISYFNNFNLFNVNYFTNLEVVSKGGEIIGESLILASDIIYYG